MLTTNRQLDFSPLRQALAAPGLLFDSLNKLKENIAPDTLIFPGHRYTHAIGEPFSYVMAHNIYMHFTREQRKLFISYRMRAAQKNLFSFR